MIDERLQRGSNLTRVLVSKNADNRKGAPANSTTRVSSSTRPRANAHTSVSSSTRLRTDNRSRADADSVTCPRTGSTKSPLAHMLREHPRRRLVVRDVEYPLNGSRNHLEPSREPDIAQRVRDNLLAQRVPRVGVIQSPRGPQRHCDTG